MNEYKLLIDASKRGDFDLVIIIIKKGASVDIMDRDKFIWQKINAKTSLIWASCNGYLHIVKYLIDKGANAEAKDKYILTYNLKWQEIHQ